MAKNKWLQKVQSTVSEKATPVAAKLGRKALDLVEKRAPEVAARLRPAVDRLDKEQAPVRARAEEPTVRERKREPKLSEMKPADAGAEERGGAVRKLRESGSKSVPAAAAKRATKKKAPVEEGFKVKRGQKHSHHR